MNRRKRRRLIWTKSIMDYHCFHCPVALSVGSKVLLELNRNDAICLSCAERLSLGKNAPFREAMKICEGYGPGPDEAHSND